MLLILPASAPLAFVNNTLRHILTRELPSAKLTISDISTSTSKENNEIHTAAIMSMAKTSDSDTHKSDVTKGFDVNKGRLEIDQTNSVNSHTC